MLKLLPAMLCKVMREKTWHKSINMKKLLIIILSNFFIAEEAFARAGGGGSGGGGGGGFSSGHSSSASSGGSSLFSLIFLLIFLILSSFIAFQRWQKIKKAKQNITSAEMKDKAWDMNTLEKKITEIFYSFQNDWSNFNVENMKSYLSDNYYKRMVLEMNVLKNENRKNEVKDAVLYGIDFLEAVDENDNTKDNLTVQIRAQSEDILWNMKENKILFQDTSSFNEYWKFIRKGNEWVLDIITQETESEDLKENNISCFAQKNGFFYDPDFGWLMMPNKGNLFKKSNFLTSDINNHVVGYYKEKIVEFYTYIPKVKNRMNNYLVAQTVLPISYNNILVRKKKNLWYNFSPRGLRRIKTESNEFDNKFCLYADTKDQINSFELLTPNFMEYIYNQPFELNIEIVDNFLYFYAKKGESINYDKMLEILSYAFEEMKR